MKYYILTLFPEMIEDALNTSILGRAKTAGAISFEAINIRDYTLDKHKKVDDYPYGGGAGMVLQAQPIYDAYQAVCNKAGHKVHCIYLTPQGKLFTQSDAKSLALKEDICLLCGHYEGIDERVLEEIVDEYYSIGDYVLTGGELPSLVMIDAISRMVPGVLTNSESGEDESLENNLLEYPQYSRPETWNDRQVPPILLSGDHAKVDMWRHEQSILRTKERRPDLYAKYLAENADNK
ncbi:MAG: tRNA (guanosine(37)-N1)-methyltransferase TrmD [Pseudobutyrivibrio sp.]|nr:tRNA (guanosine(37)-N1)-methyltransferase TrmD [Pseudobutyrivibrio sp.]